MSTEVAKAIHGLLSNDAIITDYLSLYNGDAAVFTRRPVPPDARLPYVIIDVATSTTRINTLDGNLASADVERLVTLFGPATGEPDAIDSVADRIAELIHMREIQVPGWARARCSIVNGPIDLSADDESYGRVLTVRTHLTR